MDHESGSMCLHLLRIASEPCVPIIIHLASWPRSRIELAWPAKPRGNKGTWEEKMPCCCLECALQMRNLGGLTHYFNKELIMKLRWGILFALTLCGIGYYKPIISALIGPCLTSSTEPSFMVSYLPSLVQHQV